jgi:hypothetical protein
MRKIDWCLICLSATCDSSIIECEILKAVHLALCSTFLKGPVAGRYSCLGDDDLKEHGNFVRGFEPGVFLIYMVAVRPQPRTLC